MEYYDRCQGSFFHPGGYELTRYALGRCELPKGAKLCDIGCGTGEHLALLQEEFGLAPIGLEPSAAMGGKAENIVKARGEATPFPDQSFDVVLCECTLSLCQQPRKVLREIYRILRPKGWLVFSDVCGAKTQLVDSGPLKWIYAVEQMKAMLEEQGFAIRLEEDRTRELTTMAAQMIMDGREQEICETMGALKGRDCGYYLIIGRKG